MKFYQKEKQIQRNDSPKLIAKGAEKALEAEVFRNVLFLYTLAGLDISVKKTHFYLLFPAL